MDGLSHNIASKRRKLTMTAAKKIHSCHNLSDADAKTSALNGLWGTFVSNVDKKRLIEIGSTSRKIKTAVVPNVVKPSVETFEKSTKNYARSASVLYRGGILSKRKYSDLRSSEMFDCDNTTGKRHRTEFMQGCKVPALVPYKDLMKFVAEQDIGTLYSIPQARAENDTEIESEEVIQNLLPLVP